MIYSNNDMIRQQLHHYRTIICCIFALILSGCASVNYYSQSIYGQVEIIKKRQDINTLLNKDELPDRLRKKLNTVKALRRFSIKQLGLPDNNSYFAYADLGRDYVIWNIFATEEFSLRPKTWCYLVVGCLDYRGYFAESEARQYANILKENGHDVYLGGVAAYSTLGWFDDPVLNTMLRWSDIRLATVIFHELAHQQLYIKHDTEFNEAYADAIAHIGVLKWLKQNAEQPEYDAYINAQAQDEQFITLVMKYKALLNGLYQSGENDESMRTGKKALFSQMRDEYKLLSRNWAEDSYAGWFETEINNAKLAAIVTYRKYVPALLDLYEKLDNDLNQFYGFVKLLADCDQFQRRKTLEQRAIKFGC